MSPKAKFPLGSHSAKKSIGKLLTFYDRGGKQKVRLYNKPSKPASAAQAVQRGLIRDKVAIWQAFSDEDKAVWAAEAKVLGDPWSGYTLFMSTYVGEEEVNHDLFSATHPDTVPASPVSGDIIFSNDTPKWTKLLKGDDDEILTLKSGLPSWEPAAGAGAGGLFTLEVDEDFNDLVDGDINGKGSYTNWSPWVSNNSGAATAKVVDLGGGNKILRLEYDGGDAQCHLNFSGEGDSGLRTGFVLKIRTRLNAVANDHQGACTVNLDDVVKFIAFYFQDDGSLSFYDSANRDYLDPYSPDTWYTITSIFSHYGDYLNFSGLLDGDYKCGDPSVANSNGNLNRFNLKCYDTVTAGRQFDIDWLKIWRLNTE